MPATKALGGGSGLNTIVVANQLSSNSLQVANYYCERRHVPPENLLKIRWAGGNASWTASDFQTNLLGPLLELAQSSALSNQIDYVVLSMDIPFRTLNGSTYNATTAALFYGLKPDAYGMQGYQNSYGMSETSFDFHKPVTAPGYSFLATMITGNTIADACHLIDQGLADSTFPVQTVVLEKTSDSARNIRYPFFDNAIFNTRVLGKGNLARTNSDLIPAPPPILGLQTGLPTFSAPPNSFVPGALADSLSSYGGVIFGSTGQTSLLAFTSAGAAGSYGTVDEPLSDSQKFPSPLDYFYQARGFAMAECYYQSVADPYLGLILGDPLCAPFAQRAQFRQLVMPTNDVLSGVVLFSLTVSDAKPIHQLDLFVDGRYFRTITNIPPAAGNIVSVILDGYPVSCVVPDNATLSSIATNLAAKLNSPWVSSNLQVQAIAHGDRIELRSLNTNVFADGWHFLDTSATPGATSYKVAYEPFPEQPQISALSPSREGLFRARLETTPGVPFEILASTNLLDWVSLTNDTEGGLLDFTDAQSASIPQRFYRVRAPDEHPVLSVSAASGQRMVHVESQTGVAYVLEGSTNLQDWFMITTNSAGGNLNFSDAASFGSSGVFYRAALLPPVPAVPTLSALPAPAGGDLVSIGQPARAYTLFSTTNGVNWTSVLTNTVLDGGWVGVSNAAGSAATLSTFLTTPQPRFLASTALGQRTYSVSGNAGVGAWLQLTITKTNNNVMTVATTNQGGMSSITAMAQDLFNRVNAEPGLQSPDGLMAENFMDGFGSPSFQLSARSPGLAAAGIQALLSASPGISLSPGTTYPLNQNISDLHPRDHLYVSCGATTVAASFTLNTSVLSDGFHDLALVAYEGTSVRAQSVTNFPIYVQNSDLQATLTRLDMPDTAPVSGTFHIEVTANTDAVGTMTLFSSGGALASVTNRSYRIFNVDGPTLGAGLHPFYALIVTTNGLSYRTAPQYVRLSP
ncbi:MAG TPA: TIGR03790 family protein [Verrucomicrobiae bacterium]|nr:TIGR03790 family protein [Verrucomicrobiae bacterium]